VAKAEVLHSSDIYFFAKGFPMHPSMRRPTGVAPKEGDDKKAPYDYVHRRAWPDQRGFLPPGGNCTWD